MAPRSEERQALSAPQLSKFEQMKASGDLPSPKGAALAIVQMTLREDASMADIAHIAKTDPAFVGRLIKTANGCGLGTGRHISTVQEALTVLGLPTVRGLALGFSLISSYRSGRCQNYDYTHFWSKSLARAVALQQIALHSPALPPDEAFCVGLLADVGELALATLYPDLFSNLLKEAKQASRSELQAYEREAFVMDSAGLTAALLEDWGFPHNHVALIRYFESPEEAPFEHNSRNRHMLNGLVLAEQIAGICVAGDTRRRSMMPQLYLLGGRLSLDAPDVISLCNTVADEWGQWGALLRVETRPMPSFEELTKLPPPPKVIDPAKGPEQHSVAEVNPMRVLIVDDDPAMRAILSAVLSKSGHEVYVATNGREAFEMALELHPQIMVADWMMPEMDGLELAVTLRQTRVGRAIYLILLTSIEDESKLIEAFEAGADDFITKPLKPRVLEARLRSAQRVVQLQQEIERDRADIQRFAAELAVSNRRLHEMAQTDALTALPNRRYAIDRMAQEWNEAQRSGRSLCCLVIDVDSFKQINDNYGHDAGDTVLRWAAKTMKGALRGNDVVCRTGGDEFLVLCPDTTLDAAMMCAERIREGIAALHVEHSLAPQGLPVAVSIGVAVRDADMANPDTLIKVADQGLYLAKNKGRNQSASVQTITRSPH